MCGIKKKENFCWYRIIVAYFQIKNFNGGAWRNVHAKLYHVTKPKLLLSPPTL